MCEYSAPDPSCANSSAEQLTKRWGEVNEALAALVDQSSGSAGGATWLSADGAVKSLLAH